MEHSKWNSGKENRAGDLLKIIIESTFGECVF